MTTALYETADPARARVGDKGDMVDLLLDDNYSVMLTPAEARGLALKLIYIAAVVSR